jgi:hypothetical protein
LRHRRIPDRSSFPPICRAGPRFKKICHIPPAKSNDSPWWLVSLALIISIELLNTPDDYGRSALPEKSTW